MNLSDLEQQFDELKATPQYQGNPQVRGHVDAYFHNIFAFAKGAQGPEDPVAQESIRLTLVELKERIIQTIGSTTLPESSESASEELLNSYSNLMNRHFSLGIAEMGKFNSLLNKGEADYYTTDLPGQKAVEFPYPSPEQIRAALTPEVLNGYRKMQELGLLPRLNVVPIGLSLRSIITFIKNNIGRKIVLSKSIPEKELLYFVPNSNNSINKSKFTTENQGFLIEIVPTVNKDLQFYVDNFLPVQDQKRDFSNMPNSLKKAFFLNNFRNTNFGVGLFGQTCESYLFSQLSCLPEHEKHELLVGHDHFVDNDNYVHQITATISYTKNKISIINIPNNQVSPTAHIRPVIRLKI